MSLHVDSIGSGSPLLLIHGWGMHGGIWTEVAQKLASDFRVHIIDLPGYGFSKNVGWVKRSETHLLSDDGFRYASSILLDAVVDELSSCFVEPLTVCGWSLGGQIALRWAAREPDKVRRLILVASTPCFAEREDWSFGMEKIALEKFATELEQNHAVTLRRFLTLQLRGSENERDLLTMLRERLFSRGEPDIQALRAGLNILRDIDLRAELTGITQPTLVIAGERDKLTPPQASRYMAQYIPAAHLVEVKGAAHAPFLSHPDKFVMQLKLFMNEFEIDKKQVRRAFSRAAQDYDAAAVLQREVCTRMLDRLSCIKLRPARIIDIGSGTGWGTRQLGERYPKAEVTALDIAIGMLQVARGTSSWWQKLFAGKRENFICADVEALPIASNSVDMVWSNLALQWCNDLPATFIELQRALKAEGLLIFSSFGVDTLKELRIAFNGVDGYNHLNRFADMHDIGDMLVAAGYADPVMEMETITLTYDDVRAVLQDLKSIGANNATTGRAHGMMGKATWQRVTERYELFRREGKLPATFEIIYGHAWKPKLAKDGRAVIKTDFKL